MDGYVPILFNELGEVDRQWTEAIVSKDQQRITQYYGSVGGEKKWSDYVTVYHVDNPPAPRVDPAAIGLPAIPVRYDPVEGRKAWPQGVRGHIKSPAER